MLEGIEFLRINSRVFKTTPRTLSSLPRCARNDDGQGEVGRSMIEMLGVLAIIGVLSVGGIAGYSKAMSSFKQNKWRQQIEDLIFNIKDAYKNERHYSSGLNNILPTLKSMNVVPQDMLDENDKDLFGNKVSVVMRESNGWIRLNIQFDLQQNNQAQQNCMDLFALLPIYTNSIWTVAGSTSPTSYIEFYRLCGNVRPKEYVPGCKEEYVLADVSKACSICKNTSCSILVLFDNNS